MSRNPLADKVWREMAALVFDNRDRWKRAVVEQSGLPFSRIRILKRLAHRPMTVKEVAHAATIDAPAATVAVNDLEDRGLVVRQTDPTNRRCKLVSLTDAGRDVLARSTRSTTRRRIRSPRSTTPNCGRCTRSSPSWLARESQSATPS